MSVIVANCRYEGTRILVPFLLSNLITEGQPGYMSLIWEGQIDTGFSGYLMMSFSDAQRNNLELTSSFGSWTLADGTAISSIDTIGKMTLVGRNAYGIVNSPIRRTGKDINTPVNILIGQKMLEAWSVKLEADPINKVAQLIGLPPKTL